MSFRRQEKISRVIRDTVSDVIQNRLSDPRITGLVSVTQVDVSPDLRNAAVFLSVMADNEAASRRTFSAIQHATSHIRSALGDKLTTRFLPTLTFYEDKKLKKTLETLDIIEQAAAEYRQNDAENQELESDIDTQITDNEENERQ